MAEADRAHLEQQIRIRWDSGDHEGACTEALTAYGREVFGYLLAVANNETDAADAYGQLALLLWTELPRFRWESSLRTYAYALARSALGRLARDRSRRGTQIALDSVAQGLVAHARSTTTDFLRGEHHDRLRQLRYELSEEDRALLVLRIDRELDWRDVAVVMLGIDDADVDDAAIARETARLRKRFERVKDGLRRKLRG